MPIHHCRRAGRHGRTAAVAAVVVVSASLAGCSLGQPHTFALRAEKSCAAASRGIGHELTDGLPSTDPVAFAVDRFAQLDRVLVVVSTDRGFPSGADGQALTADWIVPARASLKASRPALDTLREVAATPSARRSQVFRAAVLGGEAGIKPATLRRLDLPQCATLFRMPAPTLRS